jgi:hypothetical protein
MILRYVAPRMGKNDTALDSVMDPNPNVLAGSESKSEKS